MYEIRIKTQGAVVRAVKVRSLITAGNIVKWLRDMGYEARIYCTLN